jgi:hypothetical protein
MLTAGALENPDFGVVLRRLCSLETHLGAADACGMVGGPRLQQTLQHETPHQPKNTAGEDLPRQFSRVL